MTEVRETKIPGLGVRYEFGTREGRRIGVVAHRSGLKEVYFADPDDPDAYSRVLRLENDEARTFGEILGGSRVAEELADLKRRIEGLAIDWLPVREDSPFAGRPLGDAGIRTRTGVSVVAILRGEQAIPAPGPDEALLPGDYLVVVGTARGIEEVVELLRGG